ncbi:hypothetical protein C8Q74DRAFT_206400 [Fomes fomentarius]|nr:hypothetical protein C8Q74DRAFT_206400 [Fomes fomentarius]
MNPHQYSHHPQRQVPQIAPFPRQPPPPPPPPQHIQIANPPPAPQASYNAKPFIDLVSSVSLMIEQSETRSAQRLSTMEMVIGGLSKLTADTLELLKVTRQESKDGFERFFKESKERTESIHSLIRQAVHASMTKSERIEHILGDPDALDSDDSQSSNVLGRIARLECAMMELTESVSDPDAARPTVVRHEAAVNTSPQVRPTADVGTDAIDLLPSVAVVESGVQAGALTYRDAEIEARPDSPVRHPQTVWGPFSDVSEGGAIFSTYKPLAPAAWTPSDHDSDDRSDTRSESCCKTPAPLAQASTSYIYGPVAAPATLHQSHSASSVFDEQEIVDNLQPSRDSVSQCAPSSSHMPARSPPSSPAVRASSSLPLPRRDVIAQALPPPSNPATLQTPTAVIPIPQQAAILPEVPALPRRTNIPSNNSTCVIRLPRGLARPQSQSSNPTLSSPLTPSSWTRQNSPTRPATAPPEHPLSPLSVLSSSLLSPVMSSAMSSLSSLDSTDSSETRVQVPGLVQPQKGKAKSTSASVESATTRVSKATPGASTSASADVSASASASASVKVKVKKERENDSVTRPAKKRKRLDCASERRNERGSTSAKAARGGSSAGRARGRNGRGGAPKGGKRTAPLVVDPFEEPTASGSGRGAPSSSGPTAQMDGRDGARKRYSPPRIGTDCPWPLKLKGEEGSHREFVQCDACEGWYHFGCVGLTPDDPRLEPDAEFICPPCESSSEACEQRRNVRFQAAACLRPDCDHPGGAEDTNEYFVERIIGRRPYRAEQDIDVTRPTAFMWLVKWDGWKADQATWAANEHLGECSRIIEEFEQAVEIEGRNLSAANEVILLNEAAAAGWGRAR